MTKFDRIAQRDTLVEYINMKVLQEDWHGVADAAMDLRDLDAFESGIKHAHDEQEESTLLKSMGAL